MSVQVGVHRPQLASQWPCIHHCPHWPQPACSVTAVSVCPHSLGALDIGERHTCDKPDYTTLA